LALGALRRSRLDPWWEPEAEWHWAWKNEFPVDWQEVIHLASNGEKHVADVKTQVGTVIEFQHSFLKPEERISREVFYRKMVSRAAPQLHPHQSKPFCQIKSRLLQP
jgi:hypothetical protein